MYGEVHPALSATYKKRKGNKLSNKTLQLNDQDRAVLLYVLMQWLEKEKDEKSIIHQEVLELYHSTIKL